MVKYIFAIITALVHLVLSADSITLVSSQPWKNIFSDGVVTINTQNSNSTHTVYLPNPITLSTQHKSFSHHTSAPHYNLHCMNTQQLAWYFAVHGYYEATEIIQGVGEGIVLGSYNAVYMVMYPVRTLVRMADGIRMLGSLTVCTIGTLAHWNYMIEQGEYLQCATEMYIMGERS